VAALLNAHLHTFILMH